MLRVGSRYSEKKQSQDRYGRKGVRGEEEDTASSTREGNGTELGRKRRLWYILLQNLETIEETPKHSVLLNPKKSLRKAGNQGPRGDN